MQREKHPLHSTLEHFQAGPDQSLISLYQTRKKTTPRKGNSKQQNLNTKEGMGFHQQMQKIVAVFVLSMLVSSAERYGMLHPGSAGRPWLSAMGVPPEKLQLMKRSRSFDTVCSSKRRVPNSSDPLHNR